MEPRFRKDKEIMVNRRQREADILHAASQLDDSDTSTEAEQLRQTAESIEDHWSSEAFANRGGA